MAAVKEDRASPEPFLWLAFSAGGVVTALTVPAVLFLFGIAFPLGWLDPPSYADIFTLLRNPLARLVVVGLAGLGLMHAAHRLRHTVRDGLQLQRHGTAIAATCYGTAALITGYAVYLVVSAL
ncbi:fumarate reductase subunit FrdD [Phytohabitans rumicis]|uniref:Fumarate reductase subunit D n=1 Tax=Phytohabitans rumicis TaxID=1076125 RepID=A0A6V8LLN7_9ACTN|nr:fumarate reductase subunit FrdD [Phytohabitans rumicis]GFJ94997.1 fumarate reductase subunit D [Phytohabitans rumicis]